MQKDEECTKDQTKLNFESNDDLSKGVFVKKKLTNSVETPSNSFLFNFRHPSDEDLTRVTTEIRTIKLSQ